MTNYGDYEESLNDCVKSHRNAVKDNNAEQKESAKREIDFQREHIAIAAMQGMLASGMYQNNSERFIAEKSVEYADALINELKKNER